MWWPQRQISNHRASDAESELAVSDGVQFATHIGGYSSSSTRTELAAGTVALVSHRPVHLGSDSEAFVNKGQTIVERALQGLPTNICWQTTSDGDLWYYFEQAVLAKGPRSLKLTWVKGYANDTHIAKWHHREGASMWQ